MKCAIHQPSLLPYLGFFAKCAQADVLVLLDDVPLGRPSYTNRVRVMGPNGPTWLTVPVRHKSPAPLIRDARVVAHGFRDAARRAEAWYARHTVPIGIVDPDSPFLAIGNACWLDALLRGFGISAQIRLASRLRSTRLPKAAGNIQLCQAVGADTYLAGQGAEYDDPAEYEAAGIRYERARFTHPVYEQRRPAGMEFVPGLSVIDALANVGAEETGRLLKESIR